MVNELLLSHLCFGAAVVEGVCGISPPSFCAFVAPTLDGFDTEEAATARHEPIWSVHWLGVVVKGGDPPCRYEYDVWSHHIDPLGSHGVLMDHLSEGGLADADVQPSMKSEF